MVCVCVAHKFLCILMCVCVTHCKFICIFTWCACMQSTASSFVYMYVHGVCVVYCKFLCILTWRVCGPLRVPLYTYIVCVQPTASSSAYINGVFVCRPPEVPLYTYMVCVWATEFLCILTWCVCAAHREFLRMAVTTRFTSPCTMYVPFSGPPIF